MADRLTTLELAQLRGLLTTATPAPWVGAAMSGRCGLAHEHDGPDCEYLQADASADNGFIVAGRVGVGLPLEAVIAVAGQGNKGAGFQRREDRDAVVALRNHALALLDELEARRKADEL